MWRVVDCVVFALELTRERPGPLYKPICETSALKNDLFNAELIRSAMNDRAGRVQALRSGYLATRAPAPYLQTFRARCVDAS